MKVKRSEAYLVSITYDAGGRKIAMNDPDMGAWEYRYDALGNLVRQNDARACVTELSYDPLNRVTLRSFDGPTGQDACRQTEDVRYYYDQQPEAIGQRTAMLDGSGWTRWHYDVRGQVTREERFINEVGRFVTAWSYDSAGRVTMMRYPGGNQGQVGEEVSFSYLQQGAVTAVDGENNYLASAGYNAAGQLTTQSLNGGLLATTRSYYSYASGNHRLQSIVTDDLQDMVYSYDVRGNITEITDGAETQTFTYDTLDRLTSASASDGQGNYSEEYAYSRADSDLPGLLTEKGGIDLSYTDGAHPQAVTSDGSQSYTYDANGNQVTRGAQTLVYDAENHLIEANGIRYIYNGDGQMVRKVVAQDNQTVYIGQYVEMQITGTPPATPTPRPTWTAQPATPTFASTPTPTVTRTLTPTRTYTKTVAKTATPTRTRTVTVTRTVNPATYTATITRTITLTRTITNTPNPSSTVTVTRTAPPATKSATPTKTGTKTKTPTRTKTGSATATHTRTATLTRTATFTPTNTVAPPPPAIPAGQTWKFSYFAGSQRIAMRKRINAENTLYYLLTDHLGSTYKTINSGDSEDVDELRYMPFGEQRYPEGVATVPTDYRYTGQLEQSSIGLYYYGARWYDPALGRFLSPDSIISEPYTPLAYDRYAYVRNNPVRYTDPTGHITQEEEQDAEEILKVLAYYDIGISKDWGLKNKKWQDGLWTMSELQTVLDSVRDLARAMGGLNAFQSQLGGVTISQEDMNYDGLGDAHKVTLSASGFTNWTVVHELTHAWDGANGWNLSDDMSSSLDAGFDHPILHFLFPNNPAYWYDPGQGPPPCGVDANFNAKEDFAEAVTAYVYPSDASVKATANGWAYQDAARGYSYSSYIKTPRGQHIEALMVSNP